MFCVITALSFPVFSHSASLRWAALGFAFGALVSAFIVAVNSISDQRSNNVIGTASDLRSRFPDITVLSIIPDMRLTNRKGYYYSSYYGTEKKGEQ